MQALSIDALLRRAMRTGFRKGMSGSQAWLVLGISAVGVRALRRLANPAPEVLYRTELRGGDRFEITSRRG
jgi:hypothetical protein